MLKEKSLRICYLAVGHTSICVGVVGIFLPLVPTVPFLLLTAFCYEKGSPRLYQKLIDHKYLGPPILHWKEKRAIPTRVKIFGGIALVVGFTTSIVILLKI